jgi:hypothetical protein
MPGKLQSSELAGKLSKGYPTSRFSSPGYTDNAILHADQLDERVEPLNKPYMREELALKMRQVLRKPN